LAIFLASDSSEILKVDVWNGVSWINSITDLDTGWNNVSISGYLDSSNFTIRYKASGDGSQDSWQIDAALLHLWTDDSELIEVEFTGTANVTDWTSILWSIDSSWNISSVPVTIQLYDFNASAYPTSGDGYISYTSDASPDTDEPKNQTISTGTNKFRNSTGHWKIKIRGLNPAPGPFQLNLDYLLYRPRYQTSGEVIQYNTWQEYMIQARTLNNEPVSYGPLVLYHNGTSVTVRESITKVILSNPEWTNLNLNGELLIEVLSTNISGETFTLRATVGSVVGEKRITQNAP
jgi:hypothetical protein